MVQPRGRFAFLLASIFSMLTAAQTHAAGITLEIRGARDPEGNTIILDSGIKLGPVNALGVGRPATGRYIKLEGSDGVFVAVKLEATAYLSGVQSGQVHFQALDEPAGDWRLNVGMARPNRDFGIRLHEKQVHVINKRVRHGRPAIHEVLLRLKPTDRPGPRHIRISYTVVAD